MTKKSVRSIIIIFVLLFILVIGVLGLGGALLPLLFSFGLAYLVFPMVHRLERLGINRNKAVISVFVIFILTSTLLFTLVVPGLISDSVEFSKELPLIATRATEKIESVAAGFGIEVDLSKEGVKQYVELHRDELEANLSGNASKWMKGIFTGLSKWLITILNLFLIPLFFFYVINDFERITREIKSFIPKSMLPKLSHYLQLSNTVLSGYIRGQLMVALILGCLYALGLSVIGLKFGFLIGFLSGLFSIIPYAGLTIGLVSALLVGLANFSGMGLIVGIIVVFVIVQALEGTLITPKLVGDKVGLSALATMLALIIGGNLFGMAGMILAIPIAAIIKSILGELKKEYQKLDFYKT